MSLNLYMRPHAPKKGTCLSDSLKFILRENDEWGDGVAVHYVATTAEIPYLTGLRDAKIAGAAELIEAIERFGAVEVWTE